MRDILEKLRELENKNLDNELLLESLNYDNVEEWMEKSTDIMVKRIKAGEYPIDVINDLAREYSSFFGNTYESFAIARDALDRRAWELGLRYTHDLSDDSVYDSKKKHDGNITYSVTEEKKETLEEDNDTKPMPVEDIKLLSVDLWNNFYLYIKNNSSTDKINLDEFKKFVIETKYNMHPDFVNYILNRFIELHKLTKEEVKGNIPENIEIVKNFVKFLATEIGKRGGLKNVSKNVYNSTKDIYIDWERKNIEFFSSDPVMKEDVFKFTSKEERKKYNPQQIYILVERRKEIVKKIKKLAENPSCLTPKNMANISEAFSCLKTNLEKELEDEKMYESEFDRCIFMLEKCLF